ncbi:beta-ketoacyl-ACP synthase 3 [Streptomyces sp. NPDC048441]|uniref:beta-ketoacyl-ACP synthase 3 n=1 Tax=Streptomyces sp. NPDC048441 TaxID=3365552 RepID=UPI003716D12C
MTVGPTTASPGARILGVGAYRPARRVGNDEVSGPIESSDGWIRRHSGIVSRRFAGDDESVVAMGAAAADKALAHAGVQASDVDMVLLASMSYLSQSPAAAPQVAHAIGGFGAAAMDVGAACAGFGYALALADGLVRSGTCRHVVVVGSERMSDVVDPGDRSTAFLFADGAGAVVVGAAREPGIGPVVWGSDGGRHRMIAHSSSWRDLRDDDVPWPTLRMRGPEVFRWVLTEISAACRRALEAAGVAADELAAFIPHQANLRLVEGLAKSLGLPPSVVVARSVITEGNTSAASIPLGLEALLAQGGLPAGGKALLSGFGAGLAHASMVVTLP